MRRPIDIISVTHASPAWNCKTVAITLATPAQSALMFRFDMIHLGLWLSGYTAMYSVLLWCQKDTMQPCNQDNYTYCVLNTSRKSWDIERLLLRYDTLLCNFQHIYLKLPPINDIEIDWQCQTGVNFMHGAGWRWAESSFDTIGCPS